VDSDVVAQQPYHSYESLQIIQGHHLATSVVIAMPTFEKSSYTPLVRLARVGGGDKKIHLLPIALTQIHRG
jgi:hypothetical protein